MLGAQARAWALRARVGRYRARGKVEDGLEILRAQCQGEGEFKGSPRQVYGGRGCKLNAESGSGLICREKGAMHLPLGNGSAVKHDRKDVQPAGPNQLGRWAWPSRLLGHAGQGEEPGRPPARSLRAALPGPGNRSFKRAHLGPSLPGPVHCRSPPHSLLMHRDGY